MVKKSTGTKIDSNTVIIFNIKTFLAFILGMLGLFYGFYQLVIVQKLDKMEEHYQTMYIDQKEQNRLFYKELGNINTSIGSLNSSINILNGNKKLNNTTTNSIKTNNSLNCNNFTPFYIENDSMNYFAASYH